MTRLKGFWENLKFWKKPEPKKSALILPPKKRILASGEPRFHLTGESITARRTMEGNGKPGLLGGSQYAQIAVDLTSINGATSIDMKGTVLTQHGALWSGGGNITTDDEPDHSMLVRVKFASIAASASVMSLGAGMRGGTGMFCYTQSDGSLLGTYYNDQFLRGINGATLCPASTIVSTSAWYDLFFVWDNTALEMTLWVDGTEYTSVSSTRKYTVSTFTADVISQIAIGASDTSVNCHMDIDEVACWPGKLTPTSMTGRDGSSLSLDGASRTQYVYSTPGLGVSAASGGGLRHHGKSLGLS